MRCVKDSGVWKKSQIVDVAFNCKLPGIWFRNWKAMMSNVEEDQSKVEHLEFPV
ncbi:hypothetical protein HN51_022835, partial [Arachis hypogaea]